MLLFIFTGWLIIFEAKETKGTSTRKPRLYKFAETEPFPGLPAVG